MPDSFPNRPRILVTCAVVLGLLFHGASVPRADGNPTPSLQVPYEKDQVLYYSPTFGRLTFASADVCDSRECMDPKGPLAGRPFMDITLKVACGKEVGTEPEAKNAYLETTVTVRKRMHAGARASGTITLTADVSAAGFYEESEEGGIPMTTYPCPDPNKDPLEHLSDDGGRSLARMLDAGYDTYQVGQLAPAPNSRSSSSEAEMWRDSSCVQVLVAKWAHGGADEEQPLCASGDQGGRVRWTPN